MIYTLLIRLQGVMQSYGLDSHFTQRRTERHPTKSALIGLLANALGWDRSQDLSSLTSLRFGVRVDAQGNVEEDFVTSENVIRADASGTTNVVSKKYFLSDAAFLAGFEGGKTQLHDLHQALARPARLLFLGRKGYFPSPPVYLLDGLREEPLETALEGYPCLVRKPPKVYRLIVEDCDGDELRFDQPAGPFSEHTFGPRPIRRYTIKAPK